LSSVVGPEEETGWDRPLITTSSNHEGGALTSAGAR